jgi:hypothetical protein
MSYANLIMYNAVIPSYHSEDNANKNKHIDADKNPKIAEEILFRN